MTGDSSRARALVVAARFFGYEKAIVEEFERQGYETTFLDERPSNSAVARSIMRVRKDLIGRRIEKYYREKWFALASERFDIVLVIKGEVIPRWFLDNLRQVNPEAHFVFYAWDSLGNVKNCLSILDCFDELLSFDRDDVAASSQFSYLPLFYTNEFEPLTGGERERQRRFELSFVGTLHTDRFAYVRKLFKGRAGTYAYFYVQARWYFAVVKYLTGEHRAVPWREVTFQKLSRREVAEIFRDSLAVVDIQRRGQSGLTMRTFEVLASGSVLVTTNAAIVREPFFDPRYVFVLPTELNDWDLIDFFAQLDSTSAPLGRPQAFERYSLESWVRTISRSSAAEQ